jgi:hypothetical protein
MLLFVSISPCRLSADRLNSVRTPYFGAERVPSDVQPRLGLQEVKPRMWAGEPFHVSMALSDVVLGCILPGLIVSDRDAIHRAAEVDLEWRRLRDRSV